MSPKSCWGRALYIYVTPHGDTIRLRAAGRRDTAPRPHYNRPREISCRPHARPEARNNRRPSDIPAFLHTNTNGSHPLLLDVTSSGKERRIGTPSRVAAVRGGTHPPRHQARWRRTGEILPRGCRASGWLRGNDRWSARSAGSDRRARPTHPTSDAHRHRSGLPPWALPLYIGRNTFP